MLTYFIIIACNLSLILNVGIIRKKVRQSQEAADRSERVQGQQGVGRQVDG